MLFRLAALPAGPSGPTFKRISRAASLPSWGINFNLLDFREFREIPRPPPVAPARSRRKISDLGGGRGGGNEAFTNLVSMRM